jgi:hypothetical protein
LEELFAVGEETRNTAIIKVRFAYSQWAFPSLYYHQMLRSVSSTVKLFTSLLSLIHIPNSVFFRYILMFLAVAAFSFRGFITFWWRTVSFYETLILEVLKIIFGNCLKIVELIMFSLLSVFIYFYVLDLFP